MKYIKNKYWKLGILGIEIVVVSLLLLVMVYRIYNPYNINLNLSDFSSDYGVYDGQSWSINRDDLNTEDNVFLLYGPYMNLLRDSYTINVNYSAETQQTGELFSNKSNSFIHSNTFNLSKNKTQVKYNFYTTQNIDDLEIRFTYCGTGNFSISGISIHSNNHNLMILLFIWLLGSTILDSILFSNVVNNNKSIIFALICVSLIPSMMIFMDGLGLGHDFGFHLARIEGIAQGIKDGQFPVRMETSFNDGYGYPVSIFYGDILLYIPAILRILGFTVITSYKIYIYIINLLTTVTCYVCCNTMFRDKRTALISSMAYVTSSYRLVDIYGRSAVGEYTAFIFFPIILMSVWNIYSGDILSKKYKNNAFILAIGMTGLIYTHILSTEMVVIILVIISIIFLKRTIRKETLVVLLKAVVMCVLFSLSFIVPFLDYYIHVDTLIKEITNNNISLIQTQGAYISDYFSVFREPFGQSSANVTERMQFTPGLILMAGLILALYLIYKHKDSIEIRVFVIASVCCLFVASNLFPWNMIASNSKLGNFLAQVQFPWRYIGLASTFMMVLLGFVIEKSIEGYNINANKIYFIIMVIGSLTTCMFLGSFEESHPQTYFLDTAELPQYTYSGTVSTLGAAEYLIQDTDIARLDYEIVTNNANAYIIDENGTDMNIFVSTEGNTWVDVPRFAYPHYSVIDESGSIYTIDIGDNNKIRINFPESFNGRVSIKFQEPWYWRLSELISLISFVVYCIIFKKFETG